MERIQGAALSRVVSLPEPCLNFRFQSPTVTAANRDLYLPRAQRHYVGQQCHKGTVLHSSSWWWWWWWGSWSRRDSLKAGFSPELGSAVFLPLDCSMSLTPEGHRAKPPCDVMSFPTEAGKGEAEIAEAEGGHLRWVGMTSPSLSCL